MIVVDGSEGRVLSAAHIPGEGATGLEAASRVRLEHGGRVPLDWHQTLPPLLGLRYGDLIGNRRENGSGNRLLAQRMRLLADGQVVPVTINTDSIREINACRPWFFLGQGNDRFDMLKTDPS